VWTIGDAVPVDDVDNLGALIQRRMREKDWTVSTIARRSGLAISTVSAWKNGDRATGSRGPTPDKLRQLAVGLDLSVAEVFEAAGRYVPGELSSDDTRRFVQRLGALSAGDRKVVDATIDALLAQRAQS
jgi:transcriptional regulator with XRE-family HTH domain